jgi:hypothetical protein
MKGPIIIGDWDLERPTVRGADFSAYGASLIIPHHRNREWQGDQIVPLAALYVQRAQDGTLVGHCDVSHREWALPDLFNPLLSARACEAFHLQPRSPHSERVAIGKLVVQREAWRLAAGELAFSATKDVAWKQFAALRAWASANGVPRHVFVKAESEAKPIYFDFHSPLYVETFVALMRRLPPADQVAISEMLPGPQELWLHDADDNRYTTELRCVAVDTSDSTSR